MQHCTFVGNLAANPELSFGPSGVASVRLSVIVQDRYRDEHGQWVDGATHTVWVSAFRDFAERIASSLSKGDRVIVVGAFQTRKVEQDGDTRYFTNFVADSVGPDLRWAEASVRKVRGSRSAAGGGASTQTPSPAASDGSKTDDPWSPSDSGDKLPATSGV